ncbi:MAG: aldehyde dehydrogenase family protein [Candidatus Thermoplasmatota archaeon]|jgi:1-pyrroline-5-carboxylate dehydrogenase|nr:aldehyde dehydrogenase family protein [Candidatus Thermoplasmatota archaeon]
MPFDNENTYIKMTESGNEEKFHTEYEKALKTVEKWFNVEYPNLVVEEVYEKDKLFHVSPLDGKTNLGTFQMSSKETSERAAEIAHKSYKKWFELGYLARARIFLAAADMLSERKFEFAAVLSYENGKNRYEAMGDVDETIDFMRYYAQQLISNEGYIKFTGTAYYGEDSKSVMKPYGVILVISPFNFFSITAGMVSGPLVVGNSVILKPSSDIPLSSYKFIELLHAAGVPKENLIYLSGSGGRVGRALYTNDYVEGVVFTGSRDIGMKIFKEAQEKRPKVMVTEMGGKDTIVVTAKCDIDKAVEGVARSAFGYSGQKCSACSLALIEEPIYDIFKKKLVEFTSKLSVDDPRKKGTFTGPVVNKDAYVKFQEVMKTVPDQKILYGGSIKKMDGYYVENTILDNVNDPNIERVELFLPILAIKPVRSLHEAVQFINMSEYGLTGGIFSEDRKEIDYYFKNAEVGVVYANRRRGGSTGAMVGSQPFVGWKMSGTTGKGTGSFYYLPQFLREQAQTIVRE